MIEKVTNELMFEHWRHIQSDIGELKQMRLELREGFASTRQHFVVQQGDISLLERRIIELEAKMTRVHTRLDLNESH